MVTELPTAELLECGMTGDAFVWEDKIGDKGVVQAIDSEVFLKVCSVFVGAVHLITPAMAREIAAALIAAANEAEEVV